MTTKGLEGVEIGSWATLRVAVQPPSEDSSLGSLPAHPLSPGLQGDLVMSSHSWVLGTQRLRLLRGAPGPEKSSFPGEGKWGSPGAGTQSQGQQGKAMFADGGKGGVQGPNIWKEPALFHPELTKPPCSSASLGWLSIRCRALTCVVPFPPAALDCIFNPGGPASACSPEAPLTNTRNWDSGISPTTMG